MKLRPGELEPIQDLLQSEGWMVLDRGLAEREERFRRAAVSKIHDPETYAEYVMAIREIEYLRSLPGKLEKDEEKELSRGS